MADPRRLDDSVNRVDRNDPAGAVRLANESDRLVHIGRRYWRGYRVADGVEVTADRQPVDEAVVTKSRWELASDKLRTEVAALDRAADDLIAAYCVSGGDRESTPVVTGGGNYAVPAASWPRVRSLLTQVQKQWGAAADRWCTEDGYAELHDLVAERYGPARYKEVKGLIPDRQTLRGKFGLSVHEVPVRIVEDADLDAAVADDRRVVFAEMVAASVRVPRLEAAAAWDALRECLVTPAGAAREPRRVQARSVANARAACEALGRCGRAVDRALAVHRELVRQEFPAAEADARPVALRLNADPAEAVRVATMLARAAAEARDEGSMCDAVAAAFGGCAASPAAEKISA